MASKGRQGSANPFDMISQTLSGTILVAILVGLLRDDDDDVTMMLRCDIVLGYMVIGYLVLGYKVFGCMGLGYLVVGYMLFVYMVVR